MVRPALLLLWLACCIPAALLAGEEPPAPAPAAPGREFVEKFAANLLVAEWLSAYDVASWYASDAFLAIPEEERKGATNFICYEEKGEWHTVFGRFDEEKQTFTRMAHFRVDSPKE